MQESHPPRKKLNKPPTSSIRSQVAKDIKKSGEPWERIQDYTSHTKKIYSKLESMFGEVETPLYYTKDYELSIAVILSAQCTDERVNQVTPALFEAFPSLESIANAPLKEIEHYIFSTGFYHNKAKSIKGFANMLLHEYKGVLPKTLDEMTKFPGFGRKTANVVLSEVYGIVEGFVVDTHVKRLTYRLGLTQYKDPIRIEKEIMEKVPKKFWNNLSLYLIFHGRQTCDSRKPNCARCELVNICPSKNVYLSDSK
ncbi:MAG: endonuclease III [Leptospira sp.]|nr:endonuclease III [Leptospira sp.]